MSSTVDAPPRSFQALTRSVFISAPDGLKLHASVYGDIHTSLPLVCLPGLSRNGADFDVLASALASTLIHPRPVVAIDYRGRGLSAWDPEWSNYNLRVELADVLAILDALGISRAVFLGTSRGGLLTMALAAVRPGVIAGAILNDIGPEIQREGLLRIRSYVGKLPPPGTWDEAVTVLQRLFNGQFPALQPEDWLRWAHRTWREENGMLVLSYDPNLMRTLEDLDPEQPLPAMWPQFDALAPMPLMVIRGANSDILSEATLADMAARRPDMKSLTVPDQGHAPLLDDADTITKIRQFTERCSRSGGIKG